MNASVTRVRPACRTIPLALLATAAACVTYEPKPLHGADLVASVAKERFAPAAPGAPAVDLATATAWLTETGPAVQEARAAFRIADARARIATPWPDPTLEFGPSTAWGADVGSSRPVAGFAALAIPFPLGDRREAADEVNRARAEALRIDVLLTLREQYLGLRREWVELATARRKQRLLVELADSAARSVATARRLVAAGAATALDAALLELEQARAEALALDAEFSATRAAGTLAARTGVAASRFATLADGGLPVPPDAPPSLETLHALLAEHRRDLVALRADYAVAEHELRLEVERQYPDLVLGPEFAAEPGEHRQVAALGIGIQLPLFDRNQQEIAVADQRRESIRTRYRAAASRALAQVEELVARIDIAARRRRALVDHVLPHAIANQELARRAVEAGGADALRLLEVERALRELRVEVANAELTEIETWIELEQAVGHPLLAFPGEPAAPPVDAEQEVTR